MHRIGRGRQYKRGKDMQEIPRLGVLRGRYVGKKKKKRKKGRTFDFCLKKKTTEQLSLFTLTSPLLNCITVPLKKKVKSLMKTRVLSDCPVTGHFGSSHYFPAQGNPV